LSDALQVMTLTDLNSESPKKLQEAQIYMCEIAKLLTFFLVQLLPVAGLLRYNKHSQQALLQFTVISFFNKHTQCLPQNIKQFLI